MHKYELANTSLSLCAKFINTGFNIFASIAFLTDFFACLSNLTTAVNKMIQKGYFPHYDKNKYI